MNTDQLVATYLKRLDAELAGLQRARRREVVQEISEHIAEARSQLETQTEADIRTLLDRLGDPAEIAAEARERFGVRERKPGWLEIGALIMLLLGGLILPVIGWFVGVVMLWSSELWTTRDKVIGTVLVPGGVGASVGLAVFGTTASGCNRPVGSSVPCDAGRGTAVLGVALLIAVALLPLATTAYLAWRMRQPVRTAPAV
jgi:hypothetical protein